MRAGERGFRYPEMGEMERWRDAMQRGGEKDAERRKRRGRCLYLTPHRTVAKDRRQTSAAAGRGRWRESEEREMEGEKKNSAKNMEKPAEAAQNVADADTEVEQVKTTRVRKNKQTGDAGPIPAI